VWQPRLSERDVREITLERRDSLWTVTLMGLAAVGVPWLVVCVANDWCYYNAIDHEMDSVGATFRTESLPTRPQRQPICATGVAMSVSDTQNTGQLKGFGSSCLVTSSP